MDKVRKRLALVVILVPCILAYCAAADSIRNPLTIGTIAKQQSLPFEKMASDATLPFNPTPVPQDRSMAFPWLSPLPETMNAYPDIVSAFVGYRYNDLPELAEKGIIEPLDPLFQQLGIDPKKFFLPGAYEAVQWNGHIWAVPHRAETLVFSLNKELFSKLGLAPELKTWAQLVNVLEQVAASGVLQTKEVTFNSWNLPIDYIAALCLAFAETARGDDASRTAASAFFSQCAASKGFQEQGDRQVAAVYLNSLSTVIQNGDVCLARVPAPTAINQPGPKGHTLGFLECFALRKNSPEKREVALSFLRWLLKEDTQFSLIEASRLDLPANQMRVKYHHIPLMLPVLSSDRFNSICAALPAYRLLADHVADISFTPPALGRDTTMQRIAYSWLATAIQTGDVGDILGSLPKLVAELDSAAKGSTVPAAGGGLDKY